LLITVNWGVYIWSVNNGQVVEASLGYFINPPPNPRASNAGEAGFARLKRRRGWFGPAQLDVPCGGGVGPA
ncbi:hypothetical protein AB0892_30780, partial [Streptomyces sp. NPDC005409]|uniref:hypothetical protein n=1 Tax=Streptomyces sp. NPDC005409 TaxID=3155342 RepID=UPI003454F192